MNQAEITRLVSSLRVKLVAPKRIRRLEGYRAMMDQFRLDVTDLLIKERIELGEGRGRFTRLYAERLISEAVLNGDRHPETMNLATWWCQSDPTAVHKLFKVLVPRFSDSTRSYTKLYFAPSLKEYDYNERFYGSIQNRCIVELRDNVFPPLTYSNSKPNKRHLHNVLLTEARKESHKDN